MVSVIHGNQPVGEIHIPHNWSYADATARAAATGFVAGDVGKLALQESDNTFWILTATTPTWVAVSQGLINPMTTQDDLIIGGSGGASARLAKGTDGQYLAVDPTTHHLIWRTVVATDVSGLSLDSLSDAIIASVADGDMIVYDSGSSAFKNISSITPIVVIFDGGGSALTTGIKGDVSIPFKAVITGVRLLADQSGSVVIDIWKDTYANFPPVVGDSITASAKPTISTATKSEDTTLTGWTLTVAAGDILRFNVDSVTTIQRLTVALTIRREV